METSKRLGDSNVVLKDIFSSARSCVCQRWLRCCNVLPDPQVDCRLRWPEADDSSHGTGTPEQSACVHRRELSKLVGDPGVGVTDSRSEEAPTARADQSIKQGSSINAPEVDEEMAVALMLGVRLLLDFSSLTNHHIDLQ